MGYYKQLLWEAWRETWESVIGSPGKVVIVGIFAVAVSWAIRYHREGKFAVKADVKDVLLYSVVPLIVVFVAMYAVHFFFSTPRKLYEEEKTRASSAAKIIEGLKAQMEGDRARFIGHETSVMIEDKYKPIHPDAPLVGFQFALKNSGKHVASDLEARSILFTQAMDADIHYSTHDIFESEIPPSGVHQLFIVRNKPKYTLKEYPPLCVVYWIRYKDVESGNIYTQEFYFTWKWPGTTVIKIQYDLMSSDMKNRALKFLQSKGLSPF